ncbi:MAG: radical SAM protein [Holophagales bacterium]|nr:radical SAM protein [Holophagales bacterium]
MEQRERSLENGLGEQLMNSFQKISSLVVIWSVGNYAREYFPMLNEKYAPVAFGDNDAKKHATDLFGIPILSFEEIEARHPGCLYYIAADEINYLNVLNSLIEKGVTRSRIIIEEYKEYKSCLFLENYMCYENYSVDTEWSLQFCCANSDGSNKSPLVRGRDYEEAVYNFFAMRDRIIDELNSSSNFMPSPCLNCCMVNMGSWRTDREIRRFVLSYPGTCNFRCVYCCINDMINCNSNKINDINRLTEESLRFLKFLRDKHYINKHTHITINSGEILIHTMRDKILEALEDNPCFINSNISQYNEKLAKILSIKGNALKTSLDAGTPETFAKIKSVDLFDKVCQNLCRYASQTHVILQYIFLPGINDNERDIDGFIAILQKNEIKNVQIKSDMNNTLKLNKNTINMIIRLTHNAQKIGINISYVLSPFQKQQIENKLKALAKP